MNKSSRRIASSSLLIVPNAPKNAILFAKVVTPDDGALNLSANNQNGGIELEISRIGPRRAAVINIILKNVEIPSVYENMKILRFELDDRSSLITQYTIAHQGLAILAVQFTIAVAIIIARIIYFMI